VIFKNRDVIVIEDLKIKETTKVGKG